MLPREKLFIAGQGVTLGRYAMLCAKRKAISRPDSE